MRDHLIRTDPAVAEPDDLTAMRSLFVPGPMPTAEEYEHQRREHWDATINAIRARNGLEPIPYEGAFEPWSELKRTGTGGYWS